MTKEVYNRSLNDGNRNQVQKNLEMFPQETDSCVDVELLGTDDVV